MKRVAGQYVLPPCQHWPHSIFCELFQAFELNKIKDLQFQTLHQHATSIINTQQEPPSWVSGVTDSWSPLAFFKDKHEERELSFIIFLNFPNTSLVFFFSVNVFSFCSHSFLWVFSTWRILGITIKLTTDVIWKIPSHPDTFWGRFSVTPVTGYETSKI